MVKFNATVSESRDDRIVRNHHNGASLRMKFAQQAQHDFFVLGVQIAGRFIRQNDAGDR